MLSGFSCKRKTERWPMVTFYNILDISGYNAFILFKLVDPTFERTHKNHSRTEFLQILAMELAANYMAKRKRGPYSTRTNDSLSRFSSLDSLSTQSTTSSGFGYDSRSGTPFSRASTPCSRPRTPVSRPLTPANVEDNENMSTPEPPKRIRGRCSLCADTEKKNNKADNICVTCNQFVCKTLHGKIICCTCLLKLKN